MDKKLLVVHFGELWLKGRNRSDFVKRLERNIKEQLTLAGESFELRRLYDRLVLAPKEGSDVYSIAPKLRNVFGIRNFEVSVETTPELQAIAKGAERMLKESKPASVRINAHRTYKQLDFDSRDVVEKVKAAAEKLGVDPAIKNFTSEINISVTKDTAFLSMEKTKCYGGLPVGSNGRAVVLLSGGIDSPVAAWYAMKRGVEPVYVHVHAFQSQREAAEGKVSDIIETLSQFYPHSRAYFVPSHLFQAAVIGYGRYELILLKSFMLRLAEKIAVKENAKLIFTGENLGQVASQTPANLDAEQAGIKVPILRPLVCMDKEEIISTARQIGTYDKSIEPYKDVCSLNSANPKLFSNPEEVKNMSKQMKMSGIVGRSLKLATTLDR